MSEIQSLARGLKVMDSLANTQDGVSVTEIAGTLDIDKSSASRIIQTLVKYGWAEPHSTSRRYCLGPKFSSIYYAQTDYDKLRQVAHPFLHSLVKSTGECAHIAIHLNGLAYVLDDVETDTILRVSAGIGRTTYLHCTAVGKALLAFADLPVPDELERFTRYTITNESEFQKHLEHIRKQGFSVDEQELTIGVRCLAVPIFNYLNQCIASIGISGPSVRVSPDTLDDIASAVLGAGSQLSRLLGYKSSN